MLHSNDPMFLDIDFRSAVYWATGMRIPLGDNVSNPRRYANNLPALEEEVDAPEEE